MPFWKSEVKRFGPFWAVEITQRRLQIFGKIYAAAAGAAASDVLVLSKGEDCWCSLWSQQGDEIHNSSVELGKCKASLASVAFSLASVVR